MKRQELIEAYEFFEKAERDFNLTKISKKESFVLNRIQNYIIGKDELYILLSESDIAFCGFTKSRYVETDLNSAIRTLRNELNKS